MTDAVTLLDAHQRAWDARDAEALTNTHHEDGVIISPIFRTVRGRRDILKSYQSLFAMFPDWRYEPRQDPNVSRYFDLPYSSYDAKGKLAEGLLATDRPHTLKVYGASIASTPAARHSTRKRERT